MEERTLIQLTQCRGFIDKIEAKFDWERFCKLSTFNQVDLFILHQLQTYFPQFVSSFANAEKQTLLQQNMERGTLRREWMLRVVAEAEKQNIELILLKGALFGETLYPTPVYKKMNDIDVLIRPQFVKRFVRLLQHIGFISLSPSQSNKISLTSQHHMIPLVSPDGACLLSPHWRLCSPYSPWKPDENRLWIRKKSISLFNGTTCFQLCDEDNLLHLCLHLPFYKTGLRELADVYNLCRFSKQPLNWKIILARAQRWRIQDPCYRVLTLTESIYGNVCPRWVLQELEKSASYFTQIDTQARISQPLLEIRSVHIAKIERAFAVFKLATTKKEKIKYLAAQWQHTLYADKEERNRLIPFTWLPDLFKQAILPGLLWRAMARDHGQLPLLQLTWNNLKEGFHFLLKENDSLQNPCTARFQKLVSQLE